MTRFAIKEYDHSTAIVDQEHELNFVFLAESSFGLPSSNKKLASRVVDFLNSLPPEETLLYPYSK